VRQEEREKREDAVAGTGRIEGRIEILRFRSGRRRILRRAAAKGTAALIWLTKPPREAGYAAPQQQKDGRP